MITATTDALALFGLSFSFSSAEEIATMVVQTDSLDVAMIQAADARLSFSSSYSLAVAETVSASNLILF